MGRARRALHLAGSDLAAAAIGGIETSDALDEVDGGVASIGGELLALGARSVDEHRHTDALLRTREIDARRTGGDGADEHLLERDIDGERRIFLLRNRLLHALGVGEQHRCSALARGLATSFHALGEALSAELKLL